MYIYVVYIIINTYVVNILCNMLHIYYTHTHTSMYITNHCDLQASKPCGIKYRSQLFIFTNTILVEHSHIHSFI